MGEHLWIWQRYQDSWSEHLLVNIWAGPPHVVIDLYDKMIERELRYENNKNLHEMWLVIDRSKNFV